MKVPFFSLSNIHQPLKEEFLEALSRILDKGDFILGKDVLAFEQNFAKYCDSSFSIGVGNGLDALKIALKTLNIGLGDEVIVPAHTYIATWLAVSEVGATPVPVDVCNDTMNINPKLIEAKISNKTKAIMPVHIYGLPCDMDAIGAIAQKHKLYIVEDFAQAQGATYKGKRAGSFGEINGCSFYPSKNIGAMGDAGAITTGNEIFAEKASMIRNYGSKVKYHHEFEGVNSRLDTFQAAVLDLKLTKLDKQNKERRKVALWYKERFQNNDKIKIQHIPENCESVYHLFTIRTRKRDNLQKFLTEKGIGTIIHYPIAPHLQKAYTQLKHKKGSFPISEAIAEETLSLPLFLGITKEQVNYVCDAVLEFLN